ncbi:MAG: S41 family peptidase [Arcicella sp.]|nr:S41 family peptidase [Arcicella sp.]
MKTKFLALLLTLFIGLASCKKNTDTVNAAADLRDSVYLYSEEFYLWAENLPKQEVFNPLSFKTPTEVMQKLRTYSPFVNGKYQDRWSFVIEKATWDNVVSGNNSDTGAEYGFVNDNDLRVKLVYSKSSAGLQGVKRGWKMLKINGIDATRASVAALNTELGKQSQSIVFQKPDGTQQTLTLAGGNYKSDYVINPKVFTINGNNVGYFMFDSFLGEAIGNQTAQTTLNELDKVFADFRSKNVTELVLDLRYNGGGYGLVSNYLANLIAPSSAVNQVFASAVHNAKNTQYNKTDRFRTLANGLKLSRISIITTSGTASASEELINGLKPVMNVKLIGSNTHGKPVGYYGFPVMGHYVFPVALKNVNSVGFFDFFEGFPVDKFQTDDLTRDIGDPEEACLKTALAYIRTGVLQSVDAPKSARMSAELLEINEKLNKDRPKVLLYDLPKK